MHFLSQVSTAPQADAQTIYSAWLLLKKRWVLTTMLSLGIPVMVLKQVGTLWAITISPELRHCHSLFSPALQELKTP